MSNNLATDSLSSPDISNATSDSPRTRRSSTSSDEFFEADLYRLPSTPADAAPVAPTAEPSLYRSTMERVRTALTGAASSVKSAVTPTVTHTLDTPTRQLLTDAIKAIKGAPANALKVARETMSTFFASITKGELPVTLKDFVVMILDAISLALSNDAAHLAATTASILMRYGPITAALIGAFSWLVKQFTQRVERAVDHGGEDLTIPPPVDAEKESVLDSIKAFYNMVYYYVTDNMPTSIPMGLIKQLVAINAVFVFGRNVAPIGTWIVTMLKSIIDQIWTATMGVPYFDNSAKRAAVELADFCMSGTTVLRAKLRHDGDSDTLSHLRGLVESYPALMSAAIASNLPAETINQAKHLKTLLDGKINDIAVSATHTGVTNPSVITMYYGGAGIGKSVMFESLARAISKEMGYTEKFEESVYAYNGSLGFGRKPAARVNHWVSDDALLVNDPEALNKWTNLIVSFGTGKGVDVEMSTAENRLHRIFPLFVHTLENKRPKTPVATPMAISRRINGGVWEVTLNPEYKTGEFLNYAYFVEQFNIHGPTMLDTVWVFTNGSTNFVFSQLVTALCAERRSIDRGAAQASIMGARITASFEPAYHATLPAGMTADNQFVAVTPATVKVAGTITTVPGGRVVDHAAGMEFDVFDKHLRAAGATTLQIERLWTYIKVSPKTYTIVNAKLTADGVPVELNTLLGRLTPLAEPAEHNFAIKLEHITPDLLTAMRTQTFTVKGRCCRHGEWCYTHGTAICQSYDADATSTNYAGFCWWLGDFHSGLPISLACAIYAATHSPFEEHPMYHVLRLVGHALLGAGVGIMVAVAINAAIGYFKPAVSAPIDHSKYSTNVQTKAANRARSIPSLGLAPADHAVVSPTPEITNSWVLDYLSRLSIPMSVYGDTDVSNSHLCGIIGNLAIANRHPFLRSRSSLALHAPLNINLPVKMVSVKDLVPDTTYAQVVPVEDRDLVFVVLPKPVANFRDTRKHWVSETTDLAKLVKCALAFRRNAQVEILDGRVLMKELPPITPFPLGDVNALRAYTSSANYNGLYIRVPVGTTEGNCGLVAYSTSTHIERGSACLFGIVAAYSEATNEEVICPLSRENIEEFISVCPPGVLHLVKDHAESTPLDPPTIPDLPNLVFAGAIKGRAPFTNTRNDVHRLPFPIYHALDGMKVNIRGVEVPLPPIKVRPANLRDLPAALKKYQQSSFVPSEATYKHWLECVAATRDDIMNKADPAYLTPQSELFTIDQVLNGVAELRIPGIDPRKSIGFMRGGQPAEGRFLMLNVDADGYLGLKPEYLTAYYAALARRLTGELPENFFLVNPKSELRPFVDTDDVYELDESGRYPLIVGDAKRPRLTSTMEFLEFLVDRTLAMHLPGVLMSGQIANGCSFGADLNGPVSAELGRAQEKLPFRNSSDASNYDASKGVFYSTCNEEIAVACIRARFPFVSDAAARTVPRGARVGRYIINGNVFDMNTGFSSGHLLTTFGNSVDMTTQGRFTFTKYGPMTQEQYTRDVFALAYGDDYNSKTEYPFVTARDFVRAGQDLGITITPTTKVTGDIEDYVDLKDDTHLKRHIRPLGNGRHMAYLDLGTLNHIHAFVRGKTTVRESAPVVARAALREFFYLGDEAFHEAQRRLDAALTECGCERTGLKYLDLYHQWEQRYAASHTFRMFGRQSEHGSIVVDHADVRSTRDTARPTEKVTPADVQSTKSSSANQDASRAPEKPVDSTATDKDTRNVTMISGNAVTKVTPDAGVVSQSNLTKYRDGSALAVNEPTPESAKSALTALNPYPPIGVEDILSREYEIYETEWLTASTFGDPIADIAFPERMFQIPNISEKLSRNVYFRAGIEITVRTNGTQFVGGSMVANMLPCHIQGSTDAWREEFDILRNSNPTFVSASKSDAVRIIQKYQCPATFYHLTTLSPTAAIGHFFLKVNTPLSWMASPAPTGINVKVYARFIDIQVAGYDTNPGPSLALRVRENQQKRQNLRSALRAPLPGGRARDHSQEAQIKSSSGLLEGVRSATDGVTAAVGVVEQLMPLLGLLDKPPTLQAPAPYYDAIGRDMTHTDGLSQAQTIASHQTALVASQNHLLGEVSPQPAWNQISGLPGMVRGISISGSSASGDVLFDTQVHPGLMYQPVPGNTWVMTPMSYVAAQHRFWHGDIKFLIYLWGPSTQKCSVRVTYYPNAGNSSAVGPDDTGDVATGVYDVIGDTEIALHVPYLSQFAQLPCVVPGTAGTPANSIGSLVVQLVSPIAAQTLASAADIHGLVYAATAEGFVWDAPGYNDSNGDMVTVFPPARRTVFGAKPTPGGKATDHASVRARFGGKFPGLVPFTSKSHKGVVDPDKTHGPVELLKRASNYAHVTTTFASNDDNHQFYNAGVSPIIVHPWKFWSGSTITTLLPAHPVAPTVAALITVEGIGQGNGSAGFATYNVNANPVVAFNMPYTAAVPAIEVIESHPEFSLGIPTYRVFYRASTASALTCDEFVAAGDDFALYIFIAPAWYTVVPPGREAETPA